MSTCWGCKQIIEREGVEIIGHHWHIGESIVIFFHMIFWLILDCFRCSLCNGSCVDPATNSIAYGMMGDDVVCRSCGESQSQEGSSSFTTNSSSSTTTSHSSPKPPSGFCVACNETLDGCPVVTVRRNKFHPNCCTCSSCNQPLIEDAGTVAFQIVDGMAYCSSCASNQSSSSGGPGRLDTPSSCHTCNGPLAGGKVLRAMGVAFHPGYFNLSIYYFHYRFLFFF